VTLVEDHWVNSKNTTTQSTSLTTLIEAISVPVFILDLCETPLISVVNGALLELLCREEWEKSKVDVANIAAKAILSGDGEVQFQTRGGQQWWRATLRSFESSQSGRWVGSVEEIIAQPIAPEHPVWRPDFITGAIAPGYFYAIGDNEIKRCHRHGISLCAMHLTIGGLNVNEASAVSDGSMYPPGVRRVLTVVGQTISEGLRETDLFCRSANAAFSLLLLHTDGTQGRSVAHRLTETLLIRGLGPPDNPVSIGVAQRRENDDLQGLLRRAIRATQAARNWRMGVAAGL